MTLPCDVCANPLATGYKWFKEGSELVGQKADTYVINNVTEEDFANYTCEVTNDVETESFLIRFVPYSKSYIFIAQ